MLTKTAGFINAALALLPAPPIPLCGRLQQPVPLSTHTHCVVFHECGHVKQVLVNSAAAASCEVFPGDELLSIDGVSTRDMTAAQASILKSFLYLDAVQYMH